MTTPSTGPRVALVTGASSGIGQAAATQLIAAGFTVYGTSRRGSAGIDRAFPLLPLDVADDRSVQGAIAELQRREGRVDLLVNDAGVGITGAAEESSAKQSRRSSTPTSTAWCA